MIAMASSLVISLALPLARADAAMWPMPRQVSFLSVTLQDSPLHALLLAAYALQDGKGPFCLLQQRRNLIESADMILRTDALANRDGAHLRKLGGQKLDPEFLITGIFVEIADKLGGEPVGLEFEQSRR